MNSYIIFGLGFLSQLLFFARTIIQWFKSEHEGEVISPVVFWQISLIASVLMLFYGIFRNDFAIVLGQILVYFIYIRNLQLKNAWRQLPWLVRLIAVVVPVGIVVWLFFGESYSFSQLLGNKAIPLWLLLWGSAGQVVFTFRFIYQWIYSEREKESLLPLGFWIISLLGSLMIFVYAILRLDPVLFMAHCLGGFIYLRNILLYFGRKSLFSRINVPLFAKISAKVSEKIK